MNKYVRIYLTLLVLLIVSVVGPMIGERINATILGINAGVALTLATAFGIAVWKASMVVRHFMHLSIEKPLVKWFLGASVVLMALLWGGVAPDVQLHEGRMWENQAARDAVLRGLPSSDYSAGDYGADAHGADSEAHAPVGAGMVPTKKTTESRLPGGYGKTHLVFWSVVILVAIGTNAVPIILSLGIALLSFESFLSPLVRRLPAPIRSRVEAFAGHE